MSTVINVWVADLTFVGYMDRLRKLGEDFDRAHPGYHVEIRGTDFRELPLEIARAAERGEGPHIAECYFYMMQAALDMRTTGGRPMFTPLEHAIDGRTEILGEPVVIDDIIPAMREYYTYGGQLVSMPSIGTTSLLFSNTEMLEKAGVQANPRTWLDVEAACEKVATSANRPSHAITWSNHGTFFQQAIASQGGFLVDNANGRAGRATRADLSSTAMLNWVNWWRRLHQNGHYLYTGTIPDWQGTLQAFADRDVAIRISSSNDVNYMLAAARSSGFDITVSEFPYNNAVPYVGNAIAGTSLWLADGLNQVEQDGALAFLQYMHNPRNCAERHKANSFLPATNASFNLLVEEGWFAEHPYHRVASDHLAHYLDGRTDVAGPPSSLGAVFGDFAGNQDVMTRAMNDVLCHGVDAPTRFAEATIEAQLLLEEYERDQAGPPPHRAESYRVEFFTGSAPYSGADLENVVRLNG